MSMIVLL